MTLLRLIGAMALGAVCVYSGGATDAQKKEGEQEPKTLQLTAYFEDGKLAGYKYDKPGIESLKAGDRIAILLDWRTMPQEWLVVTIESVSIKESRVELTWKEPLKISKQRSTTKLSFVLKGDGYIMEELVAKGDKK